MTTRVLVLGWLFAAIAAAQETPRALPVEEPEVKPEFEVIQPPPQRDFAGRERIISSTGQFRVTGGEASDRANIAMLAEEAKTELLILTGEAKATIEKRVEWKVPVSIRLHGKSGDPIPARTVAMSLRFSEAGYEVVLDVHLSRGIEHEKLKWSVTSALVHERSLRNLPATESDTPFLVPPWVNEGLREATAWRLNQSDRRLYEALFKSGGLFKIEDIFSMDQRRYEDLDGASRAAFRVSSGSLVMALLEQPQGKGGFLSFLSELAPFQGEMPALLRKHFPEMNLSETSLSKWWALQLANIGGQNLATDIFSVKQTEEGLAQALRLNFRDQEGIIQQKEISAWKEVADLPEAERASSVRLAQDALVRLSYRCFPSYRPILSEYQTVLVSIAKNKTKDVPKQLTDLSERRELMAAKAERAKDYLNWFEITRARETSGAFDDYMRLKERLKSNPHRRDDNLSRYLDRFDELFGRGLEDAPREGQGPTDSPEFLAPPDLPNP